MNMPLVATTAVTAVSAPAKLPSSADGAGANGQSAFAALLGAGTGEAAGSGALPPETSVAIAPALPAAADGATVQPVPAPVTLIAQPAAEPIAQPADPAPPAPPALAAPQQETPPAAAPALTAPADLLAKPATPAAPTDLATGTEITAPQLELAGNEPATAGPAAPVAAADDAELALMIDVPAPDADATPSNHLAANGADAPQLPLATTPAQPMLAAAPAAGAMATPVSPADGSSLQPGLTSATADDALQPAGGSDVPAARLASATAPDMRPATGGNDVSFATQATASADLPDGLPTPLLSQTLPTNGQRSASVDQLYGTTLPHAAHETVEARAGQTGHDIGVRIARQLAAGKDELLIRLDPAELGRIEVRMTFERDGSLRATVAADSIAALDMLRREAGDLNRALADAGVRTDQQSLRFDGRHGDTGQGSQRGQQQQSAGRMASDTDTGLLQADAETPTRRLLSSGRVDMMA